jgi:hypothetical protein
MRASSWVLWNAVVLTCASLGVAAVTKNPNWAWTIPLGLLTGAAWGRLSWPVVNWFAKWGEKR